MIRRFSSVFFFSSLLLSFFAGCGSKTEEPKAAVDKEPSTREAGITGSDVNVRTGPGIKHSVKFQLSKGDRVRILREAYSSDEEGKPVELILTAPLTLYADGEKVTLAKGTAVTSKSAGDEGGDLLIITFELEGKRHTDSSVYIEDIRAKPISDQPWFKIETRGGRTGWVYGEFVQELNPSK
jgi:hypothetical protein